MASERAGRRNSSLSKRQEATTPPRKQHCNCVDTPRPPRQLFLHHRLSNGRLVPIYLDQNTGDACIVEVASSARGDDNTLGGNRNTAYKYRALPPCPAKCLLKFIRLGIIIVKEESITSALQLPNTKCADSQLHDPISVNHTRQFISSSI